MENYVTPKIACQMLGVHYQTLRNWDKKGQIETTRTPGNKRLYNVKKYLKDNNIKIEDETKNEKRRVCYCRVSTHGQSDDLKTQVELMEKLYPNHEILSDIGSGINFKRKNFTKIIDYGIKGELEELVIAYKDRLCRISYELIEHILKTYSNTEIIIINDEDKSPEEEVVDDLIQIVTVFSSRVYGLRSYKKMSEKEQKGGIDVS